MKRAIKKKLNVTLRAERKAMLETPPLNRKEIADNIKKSVGLYYRAKRRAVFPELGLCRGGRLRADLFVLAMNGHSVVVEVKSSVADFRSDSKMQKYLDFCHQAYLAVTRKVYKKIADDIEPGFGVFIMSADGCHIEKVLKSRRRDLDAQVIQSLAIRAAFRAMPSSNRKNKAIV